MNPQDSLIDRPIAEIRTEGLERVSRQLVLNQIRSKVGDPFDPETVSDDLRRLNRLGEFKYVDAGAEERPDGGVTITFQFEEEQIIEEVQVVGNKLISDQELRAVIRQIRGGPRDDFQIEKSKRAIEELYRERGNYQATVTVDKPELDENGVLLFRIVEGPRVRVRAVEFSGNEAFSDKQLSGQISTETAFPILRRGELDDEKLVADVASLDQYYKDRGFLDVRVGRTIELSPDNTEAKVTFLIAEGRQYTLRSIRVVRAGDGGPLRVFAPEQIIASMEIKRGDVFRRDVLDRSVEQVRDDYGRLGYVDVVVRPYEVRSGADPEVDLLLEINEGRQYTVGFIEIADNFLTREKVIRRQLRLAPGRPFDAAEIEKSEERIQQTRLFNEVRITLQEPDPETPDIRDVLVEVKERNTGSINFGIAVGSDDGVFGELSLTQANFDITDTPQSLKELVTGRAFRGAGQQFNMVIRPGNEIFQYLVSWTEPYIFETDNSLRLTGNYRARRYDVYDEERLSFPISVSRRLGDIWNVGIRTQIERVELTDIEPDAPTEIFEDEGPDNLTSIGVSLTRTTIDSISRPGSGSRLELAIDNFGTLGGGDVEFTSFLAEYTVFFTLDEDFLGRKTTLRLNSRVGYIFGGRAPTYERFYLGGRSFRGFEFRTISPKGIRADNGEPSDQPVGGDWLLFLGAQYEFPIFQEALSGVFFIDSGTVVDDPGFDNYRMSIGAGVRLSIPAFGPVPIAFDFGFPILKEDTDEEQTFSFTAEFPF